MIDTQVEIKKYVQSKGFFDYPKTEEPQKRQSFPGLEPQVGENPLSTSDYLVAFSTSSQSYCVGYVDVVNSTKISASLSTEKLSQYYEIFLNSMSKIIGRFGGKVIKNIGDCLLYYFPNSVNGSAEGLKSCLDSGIAMSNAQETICEQLLSKKLPRLNYRISADFGTVIRMNTSISSAIDLIGPPVNMCAKINGCAASNEFVIGNDLHQVTKKFRAYEFGEIEGYNVGFKFPYPVYKVTSSYR